MKKAVVEPTPFANTKLVIFMLVVAGASFLAGSSFRPSQTVSGDTVDETPSGSVISDIQQTLQNPSAVAGDTATDTAVAPVGGLVSLNSATQAELETLPGIGPSKAQAIISYRQQNGPFVRIEDLEKVKGIGPKTFQSLKSQITL